MEPSNGFSWQGLVRRYDATPTTTTTITTTTYFNPTSRRLPRASRTTIAEVDDEDEKTSDAPSQLMELIRGLAAIRTP